jgi:15-cis-phytoene synthase
MRTMTHTQAVRKDFAECRAYTRSFARTFYFASHVLPREKRMAAYALYAFCRYADEIVDSPEAVADPSAALRDLGLLRDRLAAVYSAANVRVPKMQAFQATVRQYRIPQEYFLDLIRGVEMDLMKRSFRSFAELEEYCYCVASTVGLIMTKVFGATREDAALEHAIELGKAMQLTNILRDIGEDYHRGRLYLPADEVKAFGIREEDLWRGRVTPEFEEMMKFQIRRARVFYARAEAGIPQLTDDGSRFCVKLMACTYAEILSAIEANNYDTLSRRAYVPLSRKLRIAVKAYVERTPTVEPRNIHVLDRSTSAVTHRHSKGSTYVL